MAPAIPGGGPFENIESAHAYVGLLCEALEDAAQMIEQEMSAPLAPTRARHLDALRLVNYKLAALHEHLRVSRRLLGDLRTLRRYLLDERTFDRLANQEAESERAGIDVHRVRTSARNS